MQAGQVRGDARHEWLIVAAAALATLAVIIGPPLGGALTGGREAVEDPRTYARDTLTTVGQRALDGLPGAYQVGSRVIVPERLDGSVPPGEPLDPATLAGSLVPLGADGLVPYTDARAGRLPAWLEGLSDRDEVFAAMGQLVAGCRVRVDDACTLGIFVHQRGEYTVFEPRLGSRAFLREGSVPETFRFEVVGGHLLVGAMPTTVPLDVTAELVDGSTVEARTSTEVAPGITLWWVKVTSAPKALGVRNGDQVLSRVSYL